MILTLKELIGGNISVESYSTYDEKRITYFCTAGKWKEICSHLAQKQSNVPHNADVTTVQCTSIMSSLLPTSVASAVVDSKPSSRCYKLNIPQNFIGFVEVWYFIILTFFVKYLHCFDFLFQYLLTNVIPNLNDVDSDGQPAQVCSEFDTTIAVIVADKKNDSWESSISNTTTINENNFGDADDSGTSAEISDNELVYADELDLDARLYSLYNKYK